MTTPTHRRAGFALATAAVAVLAAASPVAAEGPGTATAAFVDHEGAAIGSATLTDTAEGVLIEIEIEGIAPGEHALHVHAVGKCDPADGFKSAGDHLAHAGQAHGYLHADGPHAGDMPNQFVPADGVLRAHVVDPEVTLSDPGVNDADGAAIVVHAGPDDYKSQPSGASGDRIACAVIVRK